MHDLVFFFAMAWTTILLVASATAVVRLRSTTARILALDALTLVLVALLVLYAVANRSSYYMDAALVLALLAFVATLVSARYHGERKIL
ncbi:MAG: pH regulation protein F [Rubrobacter sp.]|nr:pH regulation protein F [Rubrobacter sp.]